MACLISKTLPVFDGYWILDKGKVNGAKRLLCPVREAVNRGKMECVIY
jgi:hypothetical protein